MIFIRHKEKCCGCEACVQVCPKSCIEFSVDEQGFFYPKVDKNICVDCGLCSKVCPVINQQVQLHTPQSLLFAVKSIDENIRIQSSSGGFFSALSEYVLNNKGIVYGASFDDTLNVCHTRVDNANEFSRLRGSKYVQSRIGKTFIECKNDLSNGRLVLFSGTPCQISALGHFLQKDYNNLITVEVVCHGVPSSMIFQQYLKETIYDGDKVRTISKVNFRTKLNGWKKYFLTVEYEELNKIEVYKECVVDSLFMKGFIGDLYIRPSCFNCPAKSFASRSDFTIADFWGQEYTFPEFDDDKGVSAVFANTDKAVEVFSKLADTIVAVSKQYDDFIQFNPSLIKCPIQTSSYKKFWKLYSNTGKIRESILKAIEPSFLGRVVEKLKTIIK